MRGGGDRVRADGSAANELMVLGGHSGTHLDALCHVSHDGLLYGGFLKVGNKSDKIDARKLAELLRSNLVRSVYHGEHGVRMLKELSRSYVAISGDLARVMTRLKAVYRSWAIPCAGKQVYAPRDRADWIGKLSGAGVRRRAEIYYEQFDALRSLRQHVRRELLAESAKHKASKLLCQSLRSVRFARRRNESRCAA